MRLNASTDYALRVLIYLAVSRERFVPASEISTAFALSDHHVSKITKDLTARGWLEARRGSGGGVRLAVEPVDLSVGAVVSALESIELVECFNAETNGCRISAGCKLKGALQAATKAFLATLDEYSLADLVRGRRLRKMLDLA